MEKRGVVSRRDTPDHNSVLHKTASAAEKAVLEELDKDFAKAMSDVVATRIPASKPVN